MLLLGIDIGGANIKVSILNINDCFKLRSTKLYYPIWIRGVDGLSKAIEHAVLSLGYDHVDHVALTMTAELVDIFIDKREGVESIIRKAKQVFKDFKVITSNGALLDPGDAIEHYMDVAAANWWCVGWFAAQLKENCVVVDIGSTTTTITPVVEGKIAAKGFNDVEKMSLGEIVYVGSLRTPVSSVSSMVPINGVWCRISSEYFANMGDVNVLLGFLREEEYDVDTPDGRGKSLEECHNRLSRIVCGDGKMLKMSQTKLMAKFIYEKAIEKIFEGLLQVLSRLSSEDRFIDVGFAAGLGDFMALDAIERAGLQGLLLREIIGRDNSIALTSASLVMYLAHNLGVDVRRWIWSLR
ncbi:MAG: hydantoinase/oxoprolinase family protein [Candidatus Nezhaarchaeota archaeon]|nr:hydantoinase/oxoprolinase family protein [Candidatus Nezhaarchaeota archaeon]